MEKRDWLSCIDKALVTENIDEIREQLTTLRQGIENSNSNNELWELGIQILKLIADGANLFDNT